MSRAPAQGSSTHPYDELTPDRVLDAVEAAGYECDGRLLALNSFENRVYQVGLEGARFLVAKFYRPGRWSDAAILEEHSFTAELLDAELPVAVPLAHDGLTLFRAHGFRYALFARVGGRAPEFESLEVAAWMGRTLARMHAVGARGRFRHRAQLDVDTLVRRPSAMVLGSALLPAHSRDRYRSATQAAAKLLDALWRAQAPLASLRLHGDCHPGNVLWREEGPLLVDFDDAASGPAVQDLWMLMTGDERQRAALLEGYAEFRDFDAGELLLIPALSLMRQVHYAGWLAARWDDPAFPRAFPYAAEPGWWERHTEDLMAQVREMQEA